MPFTNKWPRKVKQLHMYSSYKIVVSAARIVELRGERNMSPLPYGSLGFCPASWSMVGTKKNVKNINILEN